LKGDKMQIVGGLADLIKSISYASRGNDKPQLFIAPTDKIKWIRYFLDEHKIDISDNLRIKEVNLQTLQGIEPSVVLVVPAPGSGSIVHTVHILWEDV
jgi:hypothetical protein